MPGNPLANLANQYERQATATINVLDYGAKGDGSSDDTTAINNAILAVQNAGGGRVYLPAGTYNILSSLIVNADNVELVGDGWATILFASYNWPAGANNPMVWVQQPAADKRYGFRIADISFNGNSRTGVSAALQCDGIKYSKIERCEFHACSNICLSMNGSVGYYGAYNVVTENFFHDSYSAWGIVTSHNEWNVYSNNTFVLLNNAGAGGIHTTNLNNNIVGNTFDACDTGIFLDFAQYNTVCGNQLDLTNVCIHMKGCQYNTIMGNSFGKRSTSATAFDIITVESTGKGANTIIGNTCKEGESWARFVNEFVGVTGEPNLYLGNDTGNYGMILQTGIARSNRGYNPKGSGVTQPAVPASGTAQTNTTGSDCTVYVAGGTVTAVAIGGTATGMTSGPFKVLAGQTITLTYSVAPTWQWFGE